MSRAYCGAACRTLRRYNLPGGVGTFGAACVTDRELRPCLTRAARNIRADRQRLARVGACIGCGEKLGTVTP